MSYLPQGTVYGTLLNFQREHALWASRMPEAPYKGEPQAPVLYIKTANTFCPSGGVAALAPQATNVEVGASLGLVIGALKDGAPSVAGWVLMNDLSIAHDSYYRPPVKYKNLDGFLGVGPEVVPSSDLHALSGLQLEVRINGALRQTVDLRTLVRDASTLMRDVGEFMTLQSDDVLMLGTDCLPDGSRPRVRAGDVIEIRAAGTAPLVQHLTAEAA